MTLPVVGNAAEVQLGPGGLYVAPIGTAEPVSVSGALDPAFREVGWTEAGSEVQYQITANDILVAELFDPVKVATSARKAAVIFDMAQGSRQNLALALNDISSAVNTAKGLAPPAVGTEARCLLVWEGQNGSRWVFRRCIQTAQLSIKRDKAPAVASIPVTMSLEIPTSAAGSLPPGSTGFEPFWVFPTSAGLVS